MKKIKEALQITVGVISLTTLFTLSLGMLSAGYLITGLVLLIITVFLLVYIMIQ